MSPTDYIEAVAKFPGSGLYAEVANGKQNPMKIILRNGASSDITLVGASASFHDPDRAWRLLRNASDARFATTVLAKSNVSLPFSVYSDFKPRELGLTVWVDVLDAGKAPHRITAFNSTVNVVEPPTSFLDPSLLFLYALLGVIAFYGASLAYRAFIAPTPTRQGGKKSATGEPRRLKVVPAPTADKPYPASATPYDEEWVPEHLLRQRKKAAAAGTTSSTSGDEVTSGGEGTKKGRKGGKGGSRK